MRRELIAAALALSGALHAGTARADGCSLVFGQGRNPQLLGGPNWDDLNGRFNAAVASALQAEGRQVHPVTASSNQIDPQAAGRALLAKADKLGCRSLVETTVFTDDATLVLRLRVYPLIPQLGDNGAVVGLSIGATLFVTQRDLPPAAVLRMKPELLAAQMAAEYVQHDQR
jgi:hypothetical protein